MMTGAYGAELEQKFFTDAEKTNFKDALKYVTMLVWNGENIVQASPSMIVPVRNLVLDLFLLLLILVVFMFSFLYYFHSPFCSCSPPCSFFLFNHVLVFCFHSCSGSCC